MDDDDNSLHLLRSAKGIAQVSRAAAGHIGIRWRLYTIPQGISTLMPPAGRKRMRWQPVSLWVHVVSLLGVRDQGSGSAYEPDP